MYHLCRFKELVIIFIKIKVLIYTIAVLFIFSISAI